jgi:phospholipid/cholesterol/gamma-HCH transport system substrate-binding protein
MTTRRPRPAAILTMAAFAASCVGLLLFLWISFGGTVPLSPQGYRFSVEFDQAVELAPQAQVTISGVPVGQVTSVGLDHRTGLSRAVIQINGAYAPRPADTRAILRTKTLLGETYVALSPGTPGTRALPDGGTLPRAQVAPTVALDQIFSSFDPRTRRAFETWMQQSGIALTGRGEQFNAAFADLYPFALNVDAVLAVLRRQGAATSTFVRDSGQVFAALGRSPAALQAFIDNSRTVFATTAQRNVALAAAVRALPGFLDATRQTVARLTSFSATTRPLVDELRPAAVQLTPTLQQLDRLAPELRGLLVNLGPLTVASRQGLPALQRFLTESVPLLRALTPYLGNLVPVIDYVNAYRREIAAFFANSTATTEGQLASAEGGNAHYIRISSPINPETLAVFSGRPSTNRSNPYLAPGGYSQLVNGLAVFDRSDCTNRALPGFAPSMAHSTTSVTGTALTLAQLVSRYYYTGTPQGPACRVQAPLGYQTTGQRQQFPHLQPLP